ncbi:tripartite tricarboxylate transporter TctB family protein [Ancylobacter oerskovii]|uniref:Tripartite tricarboxylate transporter TctB family protein n=1 Tax=Ancylobacter oerskovii TaxID=459519 RepID=A0ABW4YYP8_9HYPH|nr:tripartite tricarboxylate transporter TctB family protein [Ancylobacter oerskovii]MBS7541709.1 tripartite tricarboxylate transporter TctB family protein [Ancylobacter oerskovii]
MSALSLGRAQLVAVSAAIAALGGGAVLVALTIPPDAAGAVVGARSFPVAVGLVLLSCGLLLLLEAWRTPWECEATDPEAPPLDLVPLAILAAGMLVNVLLIKAAGFIVASTLMFAFTARAFGARRLWLSLLIGFVLAFATYYGFARMLDLRIGGGLIEDLF